MRILIVDGGKEASSTLYPDIIRLGNENNPNINVLFFNFGWQIYPGEMLKGFEKYCKNNEFNIITLDAITETSEGILQAIDKANVVWFNGGAQLQIMKRLKSLNVIDAIKKRHANHGVVIGGTSAGAAIMSEIMITGNSTQPISTGLGLWPRVIVDQHFQRPGRTERLTREVHKHQLLGVGIDEENYVIVDIDQGRANIFGSSKVTLIHPNGNIEYFSEGEHFIF